MHGVEAFPQLRNQAFQHLVEHDGYRSIAIETDCLAALTVDAFVADGKGELGEVVRSGFSHGFEKAEANLDRENAQKAAEKLVSGNFTLEDFLSQLKEVRKMGPIGQLLGMIPGMGSAKMQIDEQDAEKLLSGIRW